jgi:hypothetical protein
MPKDGKKEKPLKDKHLTELTGDEVMERIFGKEGRDQLRKIAGKDDKYQEKPSHK